MSDLIIGDIGNVSPPAGNGLTLEELRRRVFAVVRDKSKRFITNDNVDDWINEAQQDLAIRQRVLPHVATDTFVGSSISLPTQAFEVLSLAIPADGERSADYVGDDDFNLYQRSGGSWPYSMFRVTGNEIEVYPSVDSVTTYSLHYLKAPAPLTELEHVSELPTELHPKLVRYAQAQACWMEREYAQGDRYWEMYQNGLSAHPQGRTRATPVPLSIVPEANYFESSSYFD